MGGSGKRATLHSIEPESLTNLSPSRREQHCSLGAPLWVDIVVVFTHPSLRRKKSGTNAAATHRAARKGVQEGTTIKHTCCHDRLSNSFKVNFFSQLEMDKGCWKTLGCNRMGSSSGTVSLCVSVPAIKTRQQGNFPFYWLLNGN